MQYRNGTTNEQDNLEIRDKDHSYDHSSPDHYYGKMPYMYNYPTMQYPPYMYPPQMIPPYQMPYPMPYIYRNENIEEDFEDYEYELESLYRPKRPRPHHRPRPFRPFRPFRPWWFFGPWWF